MSSVTPRYPALMRQASAALAGMLLIMGGMCGFTPLPAEAAITPGQASCSGLPATTLDHAMPWAQRVLAFQRVWPLTKGAGITIGVVDTGVDSQQPFLRGAVLPGVDVVNGHGTADTDCNGHGTFVAGLIAGRSLPGFGFAGVAPAAKILPVRQANNPADGTAQTLADGIRAAVNAGAKVINVSVVTSQPTLGLIRAVRYALARDVVIVAAAGNDATLSNTVQYPAGFPGVLAVGALAANGQRASFSETGPDIAIAAPGVNLLGPGAGGLGLVGMSGTSFAAPFVTGVAALVRSYYPQLTAIQVIHRIEVTADHPPGHLPDPQLGWGEVNPYAAVTAVLPGEHAAEAVPAPSATVPVPGRGDTSGADHTARLTLGAAAAATALTIIVVASAGLIRRGRERGWRPGV